MLHLLLVGIVFYTSLLAADTDKPVVISNLSDSEQPAIPATSYLVMNPKSNAVMLAKKTHERLPPASLTKLMTLTVLSDVIATGALSPQSLVSISKKSWSQPGSRMFVNAGSQVSVADLIQGIAVVSGNDASVAIAEAIAGSESAFAATMNQKAQSLGMHDTHFINATGLPHTEHYSSAYDLGLLAAYIHKRYPELTKVMRQKNFTYNNIKQNNRNHLLWSDSTVNGMKTGHTNSAGYCLVVSAERDGQPLIAVSLGSKSERSRDKAGAMLLQYGDRNFKHLTIAHDTKLPQVKTRYADKAFVQPSLAYSKSLTIPKNHAQITTRIEMKDEIHAPLKPGALLGYYHIESHAGKDTIPIVLTEAIEQAPLIARLYDWVELQCLLAIRYVTQSVGFGSGKV